MNSSEVQPESNPTAIYVDPEAPDLSEQEFSASLENTTEVPKFVLDEPGSEAFKSENVQDQSQDAPDSIGKPAAVAGSAPAEPSHSEPGSDDWRQQVSAKVSSYRSRSRHKPRYPSLQLQFDSPPHRAWPEIGGAAKASISFSQSVAAEIVAWQPAVMAETDPPRISLEATARVLEFPRPAPPGFDPDELAEPMLSQPRIVEAPDLLPPPPAMGGILIEAPAQPEPERHPGFDMPLQSAPLSSRLWAGAVDTLLLAIAVAMFGYVFFRVTGTVPPEKTVTEFGVALLAMLWPAYEYAFLVFSESTPGLRLAKLQIQRFDGTEAPRSLRRWRVLASFLSAASLGIGYAWCFLDEDQLTWHDRITRTHLAPVGAAHGSAIPPA
jgi:uncharacterized RDD family membrane protein YckC